MRRLTTLLTILLGGCLAGCPVMPEVFCDEVHLEQASDLELIEEFIGRGLNLFEDDDG